MTFFNHLKAIVTKQLPLLLAITFIVLIIQFTAQQIYRTSADDPQVQIAQDTAEKLSSGLLLKEKLSNDVIDIEKSLATFVVVYDSKHEPVAGSGFLDSKLPTPPLGVFNTASDTGENRITWEPKDGVRSAIVVVPVSGKFSGFVLAGKSLNEVERRQNALSDQLLISWLGTIAIVILSGYALRWSKND